MHCGSKEQKAKTGECLKFGPTARLVLRIARAMGMPGDFNGAQVKTSARDAVIARNIVWYGLRELNISYPQIGNMTGGYDHSSVMVGIRNCKEQNDPAELDRLVKIARRLCKREFYSGANARDEFVRDERCARVYAYWRRGFSYRAVARQFRLSHTTVSRIIKEREAQAGVLHEQA